MIVYSTLHDIPEIEEIYTEARAFQQQHFGRWWPVFTREFIADEIKNKEHLKITTAQGMIAAVFSVVKAEPVIWNDREGKAALYLHRMAVRDSCRGQGIAGRIVEWTKTKARKQERSYVRLDTWADNEHLALYYQRLGFKPVGRRQLPTESDLPGHYSDLEVSLFEIKL